MTSSWWAAGTTPANQFTWGTVDGDQAHSSDEWWAIDDVSLHQYGWSVATVGGSRYDLPPKRGANLQLTYQRGQLHRPKVADARTVQLIMWVVGFDPATGTDLYHDQTLQWNDSWDFLRRLVWRPNGAEVQLTRRWRVTQQGTPTLLRADGHAEVADTMTPTMTGRHRADFQMTLLMADPYFYGSIETNTMPANVHASASGGSAPVAGDSSVSVYNLGHDDAIAGVQVDLTGPLTNPRLTNQTTSPDVWVQFNGNIQAGVTITLDVGAYTAVQPDTGTNYISSIRHSGARHWFGLAPGANLLTLTADTYAGVGSGTPAGSATVRHQPPYV